ncbi:MAG TPA: LamB/YcsF family protein [Verrucomicrobiae bacterium]|nr:LamB/YcsF family protein [Verrucomicrobiae bacterium]
MRYDLNCDLGEGEPIRKTAALMRYVTSANIACGGHAGDAETMRAAVQLAVKHHVHVGAHPGLADRTGFGRNAGELSATGFKLLVLHQVSALHTIIRTRHAHLHHIKLHGALYHMVESDAALRRAFLEMIADYWPNTFVYVRAGGSVQRDAKGVKVWPEGFLDRGYKADGSLVPRTEEGALLDRRQFAERLRALRRREAIQCEEREALELEARTWCIHGDAEHSIEFARAARRAFDGS